MVIGSSQTWTQLVGIPLESQKHPQYPSVSSKNPADGAPPTKVPSSISSYSTPLLLLFNKTMKQSSLLLRPYN